MTTQVTVENLSALIKSGEISRPILDGWNVNKQSSIQSKAEALTSRLGNARRRSFLGSGVIFGSMLLSLAVYGSPYHMMLGNVTLGTVTLIIVGIGVALMTPMFYPNRDFEKLQFAVNQFVEGYCHLSKTTGRTFSMLASMSKEHLAEMASTSLVNLCRQMLVYTDDKSMSKEQFDLEHKIQKTYDLYQSFNLVFGGYGRYYEKAQEMSKKQT